MFVMALIKINSYLQHCFSSPQLLRKPWFWNFFSLTNGISKDGDVFRDVKRILEQRAQTKMLQFRQIYGRAHLRLSSLYVQTLKKKKNKKLELNSETFRTALIGYRELERGPRQVPTAKHWCLNFIGTKLLRVEFFSDSGVVIFLFENSRESRRVFWYHWNDSRGDFTKRWKVFSLKPIINLSGKEIGSWLYLWRQYHGQYHPLQNNCQHFVRDIISAIDEKVANQLISLMDHHSVTALLPPLFYSDYWDEKMRTREIRNFLLSKGPVVLRLWKQKDAEQDHKSNGPSTARSQLGAEPIAPSKPEPMTLPLPLERNNSSVQHKSNSDYVYSLLFQKKDLEKTAITLL
ncbi:hypothetical protein RFI_07336 [Reticulomyxa filosa]|uniref:PPPDE domain-containing protein n=1 Tax=Reticulomyxa filosa TaxID=46433 RepID=X6NV68_RETFI|nr:hypothetical protein RFI_07336 [Reticulomyxa filosa]|eukprot:ETO29788.1 hypothetical protein RFI_07336 [Reticulomyxa filosa]